MVQLIRFIFFLVEIIMMQYCFSNIDYYFSGFEQTGDLHHSAPCLVTGSFSLNSLCLFFVSLK